MSASAFTAELQVPTISSEESYEVVEQTSGRAQYIASFETEF